MSFNIDFEGNDAMNANAGGASENNNQDNLPNQPNNDNDINGQTDSTDITGKDGNQNSNENGNKTPDNNNANRNDDSKNKNNEDDTNSLNPGDELEFDGQHYKVAENGDIVDDKGTVFKAAAQVKDWLATVQTEDEKKEEEKNNEFDIKALQDKIGVEVTDENGKPVEFENNIEGVKAYVDSVMNIKSKEISEATINRFLEAHPIVPQFLDYIQVNGSPIGFGQIPDRSGIQLNKENEAQLEAVIRMAAKEFGNASLNDNYIKYLKDSGSLYDEAETQLKNLIEKDKHYMANMKAEAAAQREEEQKNAQEYWDNVNKVIESRNIAGFKIPESFTKEHNGKKVIITPNDFYDYLTRCTISTENGDKITAYNNDLNLMSDDELLQQELLSAWLMFTGGTYKDLANMAIQENKVQQLKLKSKEQRSIKPIRFVSKVNKVTDINDIVL